VTGAAVRLRVNTQVIDERTDSQTWTERYDRNVADVFAIESELAGKIVAQLKSKLSPEEKAAIEERPTADLAAHDLYIRAKTLIATAVYSTPLQEGLFEAVRLLDQAIERDPAFALAYYQLAYAHDLIYFGSTDHTRGRLAMADSAEHLQLAFVLAPQLTRFHQQIPDSYYLLRRYPHEARALDRAIAVTPKQAALHASRAEVELDWHPDPGSLLSTIEAIAAED